MYGLLKPTGLYVNVELKGTAPTPIGHGGKVSGTGCSDGHGGSGGLFLLPHNSMMRVKELNAQATCGLLYACVMVRPWEYAAALGADAPSAVLSFSLTR